MCGVHCEVYSCYAAPNKDIELPASSKLYASHISGNAAHYFNIFYTVWYSTCWDKNICFWKRLPCYKDTQQQIHLGLFSPMFAYYIGLVLAAYTGQKGWLKKCFILVPVYMHGYYRWYKITFHKLINKYLKTVIFSYCVTMYKKGPKQLRHETRLFLIRKDRFSILLWFIIHKPIID